MVHPLGPRPRSFFGLEDGYEDDDWRVTEYRIQEAQRRWDAVYRDLPWLTRVRCHLAGEVTEDVGTSDGHTLHEAYCGMTCAVCGGSVILRHAERYECSNPVCQANEDEVLGY